MGASKRTRVKNRGCLKKLAVVIRYRQTDNNVMADMPPDVKLCVHAWNLIGGEIRVSDLPIVCDIVGYDDTEELLLMLCELRKHKNQDDEEKRL